MTDRLVYKYGEGNVAMDSKTIDYIAHVYGDYVVNLAITNLLNKGIQAFLDMDVEAECAKISEEKDPKSIFSTQMQVNILRCCKDIAELGTEEILRYVKATMMVSGVSSQEGKMLGFYTNAACEYIDICVVPSATDEEDIETAVASIENRMEEYGKEHNGDFSNFDYRAAIEESFRAVGVKTKLPKYHKTYYL